MNAGVSLEDARGAKSKAAHVFQELVGDAAVGIVALGDDRYGLKINLTTSPGKDIVLPQEIEGVPVQIEIVGKIRKR